MAVSRIKDPMLRADTLGHHAGAGGAVADLFARQGSLPAAKADETFAALLTPFAAVRDDRTLFDAGRGGVTAAARRHRLETGRRSAGAHAGPAGGRRRSQRRRIPHRRSCRR